jgi:predicted sugar kinase
LAQTASDWQSISQTLPELDARQLASLAGRGLRSAVGLQGFLTGGLILDEGYQTTEATRPIDTQYLALPDAWRVVLVRPANSAGVSGDQESHLLDDIARAENPHRDEMHRIAAHVMSYITRCPQPDFAAVMEPLEAYMQLAGALFANQQGGMYNGPIVANAAAEASRVGLRGVGQSSWGPTIFGFSPDDRSARNIVEQLGKLPHQYTLTIAQPARQGAQWRTVAC